MRDSSVIEVTDATFTTEVLERSRTTPVVVDLWAPWCGPCRVLGPVLEKVVREQNGRVVLAKVNVDENPRVAEAFQVQSIPAVYAVVDSKVVDGFIGAVPEPQVREFVSRIAPEPESEADKLARTGRAFKDEEMLKKALQLDEQNEEAILGLAEVYIEQGRYDEALSLLARLPEAGEVRRLASLARLKKAGIDGTSDIETKLGDLLPRVKTDEGARKQFLDLLEQLDEGDPRRNEWRKKLANQLL